MPKYSNYVRTRIKLLHNQGLHPAGMPKTLKSEGFVVSLSGIICMIKKLRLTRSVANLPCSGRPRKLSVEARAFIDQQMCKNDEMTSAKIQKKLAKRGICVSSSTVWRLRKQQGWTLQRTAYCQLIRDAKKINGLEFTQRVLESGDTFHNVIFRDECLISLQSYRRICFRMADEPSKRKPKPKHPLKVHVWGGLAAMVPPRFVSLMASWMLISSATYSRRHSYHLSETNSSTTSSCETMIQNTRPGKHKLSLRGKTSTGGALLQRVLTSTHSKTCGMNLSSTWNLKPSHPTSKSW